MDTFTDLDLELFEAGRHSQLDQILGAHLDSGGVWFRVWAPNARAVHVIGEFDGWGAGLPLLPASGGVWSGFVRAAGAGQLYKYRILGYDGSTQDKADPLAAAAEPSATASIITDLRYDWHDQGWMAGRASSDAARPLTLPLSIYEVHLGSWRAPASYRGLAEPLAEHVLRLGFTHVELLPIMEHPFYGSWGYQTTGYFAPTTRYGAPQDLMYLVDTLHARGIGVVLDWAPAHFADDPHGLARFDGTPLYEHADPRRGRHPKWGTLVFDYRRPEVRSFLISSACSWLERYHADGLRVDAVTSMLYRDYFRAEGEWVPNDAGGREDWEAVSLLRDLNETVHARFPGALTFAEEATDWPLVTHAVSEGGLGFDLKWDVGWMNDTLSYLRRAPAQRTAHHRELTFREMYSSTENFLLALSHDEASAGEGSLLAQMPGAEEQRFANLRALLGLQFATPGKKLVFMGTELAPEVEWDHDWALDWSLAEDPARAGVARWIEALNRLYRSTTALHEGDCTPEGFEWVIPDDDSNSVFAFERRGGEASVLVVASLADRAHEVYRVGVADSGRWTVALDSTAAEFGGGEAGGPATPLEAEAIPAHGRPYSIVLRLPGLAVIFLTPVSEAGLTSERTR